MAPITPLILAGGLGTRLWPLSRKKMPKQFHAICNKKTMLQETALRLKKKYFNKPIVVCNDDHKFIVKEQLQQIGVDCDILIEPLAKSTAPAIALVSHFTKTNLNLLVVSTDHFIKDEKNFCRQIKIANETLEHNKIIIFGVKPSSPNTNYGYIETKKKNEIEYEVISFKEKPDFQTAVKYLKKENTFWNTGIFLFKANTFLHELKKYNPSIYNICKKTASTVCIGPDFTTFHKKYFKNCPNKSIDYAIMEYTKLSIMFPLDTIWNDVGTWGSVMEISKKNRDGNVTKGNIVTNDTRDSIIYSLDNKLIATNGIKDLIIIDTQDSLLVSSIKDNIETRPLIQKIKKNNFNNLDISPNENRPWGSFELIGKSSGYKVKKIIVKPGGQLSLQRHKFRAEHWVVISGTANVIKEKNNYILKANESIFIPKGTKHSLKNEKDTDLIIIETQTGEYLEEDDIERFEDIYNR